MEYIRFLSEKVRAFVKRLLNLWEKTCGTKVLRFFASSGLLLADKRERFSVQSPHKKGPAPEPGKNIPKSSVAETVPKAVPNLGGDAAVAAVPSTCVLPDPNVDDNDTTDASAAGQTEEDEALHMKSEYATRTTMYLLFIGKSFGAKLCHVMAMARGVYTNGGDLLHSFGGG